MIEINNAAGGKVPVSFLKNIAERVLQKEGQNGDLSVALVDKETALGLNREYRKKSYVPNVLSFKEKGLGLGEIVLCPEQIFQDAAKYGITFKEELARVLIHGILHVLGYGHEAMKKKEKSFEVFWSKHNI